MHLADLSLPIDFESIMLSVEFQPMTFGNGEQCALAVELQTNHIYSVKSLHDCAAFLRMVFQRFAAKLVYNILLQIYCFYLKRSLTKTF